MKQYRNSERTRRWIRRAFTELIAEKREIGKITVTQLCARADITKTTFYYHYADIYAVAEEIETELTETLSAALEEIEKNHPDDYTDYIHRVLTFIKENEESYRQVVRAADLTAFAAKLKTVFRKRIVDVSADWGLSPDYDKRAVQVCFFVSASADTVIEYLKGSLPASIETVGDVICDVVGKLRHTDKK